MLFQEIHLPKTNVKAYPKLHTRFKILWHTNHISFSFSFAKVGNKMNISYLWEHYGFCDSARNPLTTTSAATDLSKVLTHRCKNRPPEKKNSEKTSSRLKFAINILMHHNAQVTKFKYINNILLTCHRSSLRTVDEKWGFSQLQNCNTSTIQFSHHIKLYISSIQTLRIYSDWTLTYP